MKSIQLASICCIAIACASQTESRKPAPEIPAAATPAAVGAATPAASPAAAPATQGGSSAPGAMTASEAAEKAHQEWLRTHGGGGGDPSVQRAQAGSPESGAGGADQSPCAGDADCSLTRIAAGGCCPTLCAPRAVTRKRADELEAGIASCTRGKACVEPLCRPPQPVRAACEGGRCVERPVAARE